MAHRACACQPIVQPRKGAGSNHRCVRLSNPRRSSNQRIHFHVVVLDRADQLSDFFDAAFVAPGFEIVDDGGQRGRVEAGKIPGGNSYGYNIIRQLKEDGTVTTGEREINLEQASIIRRIFEEYANGQPPRKIASSLNAEGIASPRGGKWNASTINGSRQRRNGILNNELYLGRITYNRQRYTKDPETGKMVDGDINTITLIEKISVTPHV